MTNPAARTDPKSPIYGMPILNVDQAHTVVVLKRSMSPGFAGIDNPLYYNPRTLMLFGDARAPLLKLLDALKELRHSHACTCSPLAKDGHGPVHEVKESRRPARA